MNKLTIVVFTLFSINLFSQDALTIVENKRTNERISSYCTRYENDSCQELEIRHEKQNETQILKTFSVTDNSSINEAILSNVYSQKTKLVSDSYYDYTMLTRKLCHIGREDEAIPELCAMKATLFFGSAALIALMGASYGTVLFLNGSVLTFMQGPRALLQLVLLPAGLVGDIGRAGTILPFKKIKSLIQRKKFAKKVYPLAQQFALEGSHDWGSGGVIEVNNSTFKKLLELFSINDDFFSPVEKFELKLPFMTSRLEDPGFHVGPSCSEHIFKLNDKANEIGNFPRSLLSVMKGRTQISRLYTIDQNLDKIKNTKIYQNGFEQDSYNSIFNKSSSELLELDVPEHIQKEYKVRKRLKKLARHIDHYYSEFYEEWLQFNKNDVPWEIIQKHRDGLKVSELVSAYKFIKKNNVLCYDLRLTEDLKEVAHTILGVHFSLIQN